MKSVKTPKNAHLWARDPDDFYVDPRWCSAALFATERFGFLDGGTILDPCCGLGHILDSAADAGYSTIGGDIKDRGASKRHQFHLRSVFDWHDPKYYHINIVTNPPYLHGDKVARHLLSIGTKVALLLRAQWANAGHRSRWLESQCLKRVLVLTPRPSMPPGGVLHAGLKYDSGGLQDYSWYIFERGYTGEPTFGWARRPQKHAQDDLPGLKLTPNRLNA